MFEHYKENENVLFLFVSVDKDANKWKAFTRKGDIPKGIHVNHNVQNPNIYDLYRMSGIPHYILIDKDGKIKVNKGPRPSEKESLSQADLSRSPARSWLALD